MKRKKSKKLQLSLIISLLIIIIGLIFALLVIQHHKTNKSKNSASQVPTHAPVKVDPSKSNGVISSSSVVASDNTEKVDDAGESGWIKIPSKGTGEKFTNLSSGSLTIYKAHNPQVLKTATATHPNLQVLSQVMAQYPDALVMNASGFNMDNGAITGFQINNGKLITNWGENKRANEAFVINKDGSMTTYDSSTPASQILANGAEQSYSFGEVLIKDGKVTSNNGSVNWMIHSFIGNDKDNNLYLIISETGAGYENIINQIASLNLTNLVLMDGGGSSQMGLNNQTIVASQDNRQVGDFIVLK